MYPVPCAIGSGGGGGGGGEGGEVATDLCWWHVPHGGVEEEAKEL